MAVAQVAGQFILTAEDPGSNPVFGVFFLLTVSKRILKLRALKSGDFVEICHQNLSVLKNPLKFKWILAPGVPDYPLQHWVAKQIRSCK